MSVAGILSSSLLDFITPNVQNKAQQFRQEFQQLGQDLQSGNLSAAQADFAPLQQSGPQATSTSASNNPIATDFKQLSQDLQSGNVASAQQDYTKIQQDFQNRAQGAHPHHHHHGGGGSGDSGVSQLLQQLGQELQSGNLSAAQQAYNALQQDFPQLAQTSGVLQTAAATSNGVSVSA
jgi:hypothetical protein